MAIVCWSLRLHVGNQRDAQGHLLMKVCLFVMESKFPEANHMAHSTSVPEVTCVPCNLPWLSMSTVFNLKEPMKNNVISGLIKAVWDEVDRVISLSSIQALVVFGSKEAMVKALSEVVYGTSLSTIQ